MKLFLELNVSLGKYVKNLLFLKTEYPFVPTIMIWSINDEL